MRYKTCNICQETKEEVFFYKRYNQCKECIKTKVKQYSEKNKTKIKKSKKDYFQKNKEKIYSNEQRKEYQRKWRKKNRAKIYLKELEWKRNNKEKIRKQRLERLESDVDFILKNRLRVRLRLALKFNGTNKDNQTLKYIGCTKEELKKHLEITMTPEMSWEIIDQLHIDHIIPFDFFKKRDGKFTEQNLYEVMNYKNLQLLYAKDNLSKGSKSGIL